MVFISSKAVLSTFLFLSSVLSHGQFYATADVNGLSSSPCAYGFTVCSPSGGSEKVDFRSHFAVYAAQHKLSGWVRNGCDNCVHGMFAGGMSNGTMYCDNAHDLAVIMIDPTFIIKKLDSKIMSSRHML